MKNFIIALLILIPLLGAGQSPAAANKSMESSYSAPAPAAAVSAADMERTFTAISVNAPQVGTFQQRGIQKLKDFYNYLTIISNPTYDKVLRENAKTQAKQLFYGSDCSVNGKIYSDFIDSCFNLKKGVEWKAVDVMVAQSMNATTDNRDTVIYKGELSFKESKNGITGADKKAEIVLSKGEKQFGNTKKEVWSIYICLIE
ncbi:MAG TPA: hypothetical protein VK809_12015 [Bacteroidia bacterium]|jgi:hypothetical protein|nr:hypothetical protein [Bacteroidia bacterium]